MLNTIPPKLINKVGFFVILHYLTIRFPFLDFYEVMVDEGKLVLVHSNQKSNVNYSTKFKNAREPCSCQKIGQENDFVAILATY